MRPPCQKKKKKKKKIGMQAHDPRRILKVPDDFMFFLRTIGLLRGLATTLEAKVPYLELLYLYARRALLREQLGLPPVGPPALTRTAARAHA
mmetsp:Transcript_28428/g.66677  ORF Transcript_28428/g.66677 Transcript_28428/m.66677 type:complete len:92 (-) Transcript_28428:109-384(-)